MKRLHIHLSVPNLDQGIHFYSQMFDTEPTKQKEDYAKWQLDDPMVNFAISTRGRHIGLDHLGLQVSDEHELNQLNARLHKADIDTGETYETTCCYAESVKAWSVDPAGIAWESFITMKDARVYGENSQTDAKEEDSCCAGAAPQKLSGSCC